jgi:hypothetical protein
MKILNKYGFPCVAPSSRLSVSEKRRFVAAFSKLWLEYRYLTSAKTNQFPAIIFDIDDTLINGHQLVKNGFEYMVDMYHYLSYKYIIHMVTARPHYDKRNALQLLADRKININPDRLHMLPGHIYDSRAADRDSKIADFKWMCHELIEEMHQIVAAKFGDRLWDVAHRDSLYTNDMKETDTLIFFDPKFKGGTLSVKLPGAK